MTTPDAGLRALHEFFGRAFFALRPDAPPDAIVYEVDAGRPGAPNTVMLAGIPDGEGGLQGEPIQVVVAKAWLKEFYEENPLAEPVETLAPC